MQAEHQEIIDFLRSYPPFDALPDEALALVAAGVEVSYFKAGTRILTFGQQVDAWYVVRSGAVEVYRRNGELYNRLSAGGYFGQFGLLRESSVRFPVTALEDTLVWLLPAPVFHQLFAQYEAFADVVEVEDRTRLRHTVARTEDANELLTSPIDTLIGRKPVTIETSGSIREAATIMSAEGVSSLLVMHPGVPEGAMGNAARMAGMLTDRDLRTRVIARGLSVDTPVGEIMTPELIYCEHHQMVFEAMLTMMRHNVHHLPVLKQGQPIGVISQSDIIRYESQNSLFVVSRIFHANSVDELSALSGEVRACFRRIVREDANSKMIGSAMAVIGRSFTQRLLELAEQRFGPPPVPYCFLALGSMARQEQLIVTDQDNALVLDNRFDPARHDGWFLQLATFVSDGLAACGYRYCTGGIMATTARWRQPLAVWEGYFADWTSKPTPQTLLESAIFFDLDGVWGKTEWADHLNQAVTRQVRHNARFLACMARNALLRTPPLGFFKGFVMEPSGDHSRSINMKRRGTAPLADLIRVHALAVGSRARNSFERLQDIIEADILPHGRGQDLRDALEFISMVRIRHQALDLDARRPPDNNIEPENLSDFERKNLKDAFQILSNAQKFLKYRYQAGRIR
jgi:CBS domain-containing protein